ncbi:AsnC family transcriptional regulator [Halobacteriales archaeon SW_12_71_31]|nr:MAG: AsnC family transcriptional regulator [Halobacteriales archaeon SW_12_71_31]
MDDLDRAILAELNADARTPYTEIAERVGTSEGTVRNRVEGMLEDGVIERFTVTTRTGNLRAMVEIDVAVDVDARALSAALAEWQDVDFVWQVGGERDVVLVVDAADTDRLNDIISRARERSEVRDVVSRLILEERVGDG